MHLEFILLSRLIIFILNVSVLDIAECIYAQRRHVDMAGEHLTPIEIGRQAVNSEGHSDADHVGIDDFEPMFGFRAGWNVDGLGRTKLIL